MCGIVGIVGGEEAAWQLVDGLRRLEYRGYDSAGVATLVGQKLTIQHHALGDKQPGKFPAKLFRAKVEAGAVRAAKPVEESW